MTDGERRRLYTACSRALHEATLLADGGVIRQLNEMGGGKNAATGR